MDAGLLKAAFSGRTKKEENLGFFKSTKNGHQTERGQNFFLILSVPFPGDDEIYQMPVP